MRKAKRSDADVTLRIRIARLETQAREVNGLRRQHIAAIKDTVGNPDRETVALRLQLIDELHRLDHAEQRLFDDITLLELRLRRATKDQEAAKPPARPGFPGGDHA